MKPYSDELNVIDNIDELYEMLNKHFNVDLYLNKFEYVEFNSNNLYIDKESFYQYTDNNELLDDINHYVECRKKQINMIDSIDYDDLIKNGECTAEEVELFRDRELNSKTGIMPDLHEVVSILVHLNYLPRTNYLVKL